MCGTALDMLKSGSLEDKVYKLLQSKPQGVYGKRLGKELEAMFHQVAPPDVLHRAKIMPFVKWEEIVPGVCILYPKPGYYPVENGEDMPPHPEQQTKPSLRTPEAVSPCSPSQSVPKQSATSTKQEHPVPSSQSTCTSHTPPSPRSVAVAPSSQPSPSPLLPNTAEFSPDLELFDVFVCHINSPISFYVQLNGKDTSERFQAMEEGLNKHFSNRAEPACVVSVDRLYGYCWEGEEEGEGFQWCRALVVAVENNKVCFQLRESRIFMSDLDFEVESKDEPGSHPFLGGPINSSSFSKVCLLVAGLGRGASCCSTQGGFTSMFQEVGDDMILFIQCTYPPGQCDVSRLWKQ